MEPIIKTHWVAPICGKVTVSRLLVNESVASWLKPMHNLSEGCEFRYSFAQVQVASRAMSAIVKNFRVAHGSQGNGLEDGALGQY